MNKQQAIQFTADRFITDQLKAAALIFFFYRQGSSEKLSQQALGTAYHYKKNIEAWEAFCTELSLDPAQVLQGRPGADFFAVSDPAINGIAPPYGNVAPSFSEIFNGESMRSVEELKSDIRL